MNVRLSGLARTGALALVWGLFLSLLNRPAEAQLNLPLTSPASEREAQAEAYRNSPRYTIERFLELTDRGEDASASAFLSWPYAQKERVQLTRQLKAVIDRRGWINRAVVSASADGNLDDVPDDSQAERIGEIKTSDAALPIMLQKSSATEGPAWLFDRNFLKKIPDLHKELSEGWLARWFPEWMTNNAFAGLWVWQWLALVVLTSTAAAVAGLLAKLSLAGVRKARRLAPYLDSLAMRRLTLPLCLLMFVTLVKLGRGALELPFRARSYLTYGEALLIVIGVVLLGIRCADTVSLWLQRRLNRAGKLSAMPMVPPLRKGLKIFVSTLAILVILRQFGFDITAIMAGLGVGGIAVALAGQKTIENLFGGITLILDQPVRVGDFCRFGTQVGTIEDIGLRSTRIRTLDRTLISVPNADFSHMQLENFAKRDKIRFFCVLALRYDTTPDQLRLILVRLKELLLRHAMVEKDPARARFIGFGTGALNIEIFAYVRTSDHNEYLAVAEDLNLRIMDLIAECGSQFALPSQSLYWERAREVDSAKIKQAHEQLRRLDDEGGLPLPFYPAAKAQALSDSLPFAGR